MLRGTWEVGRTVSAGRHSLTHSLTHSQWLARTSTPHVDPADRRRLDFVVYGATPLGEALCCDVTLVAPLTREGRPPALCCLSRRRRHHCR